MPKQKDPLLNLTNAYLAVEDLLNCEVISPDTRQRLQTTLKMLDKEAGKLMREHAEKDKEEKAKGSSAA